MGVFVFFHIYCLPCTPGILHDQITKLHFSGTYDTVDKIYCFLAGEHIQKCQEMLQKSGSKFSVEITEPHDKSYERLTLERIHTYIQPEDKFLYIHTKGVTKPQHENVRHWKTYMEYFLMKKHKECLDLLDTHDAVGVNWHNSPQPHFSGNMWWCRGSYFLTLPTKIGGDYWTPEFYLGWKNPKTFNWMESKVDHYHNAFPFEKYVDRVFQPGKN